MLMFAVMSGTAYGHLNDPGVMFQQHWQVESMGDREAVLHIFRGSLGRQQISVTQKGPGGNPGGLGSDKKPDLQRTSLLTFPYLSQMIRLASSIMALCHRCHLGTSWTCWPKTAASAVFPHILWFTNLHRESFSSWITRKESATVCPSEQSCLQRQTGSCQRAGWTDDPLKVDNQRPLLLFCPHWKSQSCQSFRFQSLYQLRKPMSWAFSPGIELRH